MKAIYSLFPLTVVIVFVSSMAIVDMLADIMYADFIYYCTLFVLSKLVEIQRIGIRTIL